MSRRFDHHVAALSVVRSLVLSVPVVAGGQSLDPIPASARVRIDFPTTDRSRFHRERVQSVVGNVETIRADTLLLVIRPGAVPLRIPRSAVRNLYVSAGRPPRWRAALEGAVRPALIAAALGAAGASIHRKEGDPSPAQMAASSAAWAGATGAIVGAWSPKERWRPISLQDSIARQASSTRSR
jgi:hypothetical protein